MKKILKTNGSGLLAIFIALVLTSYFAVIIIKFPLVGLEVVERNHQWIVDQVYKNGWASSQSIEEGDIIKLVNGKEPANHSTVKCFKRVELAKTITILDKKSKIKTFSISYSPMDKQYIYLLFPFIFAVTTISLSILLCRGCKDDRSAKLLIYFLLATGVCYLSAFASARGDMIGRITNTLTLTGSLILFIHFLKRYLLRFNLLFIKTESLLTLYILNTIVLLMLAVNHIWKLNFHIVIIQLLLFLLLICFLLFNLIKLHLKSKNSDGHPVLKIIWITLFLAFSPFVCLYVIPIILMKKELVPAEISAMFLIIIPIAFVYLLLAKKLFDIEFLLSRLRYYLLLSCPFTVFTVAVLSFILNIKSFSSLIIAILFTLSTCILFLYVKEYLDYRIRHHLFSQKNKFETSLFTFFQKAKYETKVDSLITHLMIEIRNVLMVKKVLYLEIVTEDEGVTWSLKNRNNYLITFVKCLENIKWNNYQVGSLNEVMDGYVIVISGDCKNKKVIYFGMKRSKINLNIQERIWLETVAYFSSILLENFQLIEGLFEQVEDYKKERKLEEFHYPYWFSRLMFSLSEKERTNLSIDLHDSVLQEQLQLLRKIEKIKDKVSDLSIKNDLIDLKEGMIDNVHLVRETCNQLRPPFLSELGIIQSIQNLIEQTRLRCNFILKAELDQSIQMIDKECELTLYRVVQELLNNAMKHSQAYEVMISLQKNNQIISLIYRDNGKGFEMRQLDGSFTTMGIFGMKERVMSIGGTIEIDSALGKGTEVFIEIKLGGSQYND